MGKNRQTAVILIVIMTLVVGIGGYFIGKQSSVNGDVDVSQLQKDNQQLVQNLATLKVRLDSAETEIKRLNKSAFVLINEKSALEYIQSKGIDDPKIIVEDLYKHPELISIKAVLGGTMRFTKAYMITENWVAAEFEDGHIYGIGIYEWSIENGEIKWEEVRATNL